MALVERRFLTTRVARRLLTLFVLCALLPLSISLWLSYRHVTRELAAQGEERLSQAATAAGMSVIERLMAAESELALLAGQEGLRNPGSDASLTLRLLGGLAGGEEGSPPRWSVGERVAAFPELDDATRAFLDAGGTHLVLPEGSRHPVLLRRDPSGHGLLAAPVRADSMWATAQVYSASEIGRALCVLDPSGEALACPHAVPAAVRQRALAVRSEPVSWQDGGEDSRGWAWQIFLSGQFRAPAWVAIVSEPAAAALAPLHGFTRAFVPTLLLALWSVLLLSNVQIRRTIDPLDRLKEGTRRIAHGDFESRVQVRTKDEFNDLAESFNTMADDLGRQFRTLEALHQLDRHALESRTLDHMLDGIAAPLAHAIPGADFSIMILNERGPATLLRNGADESGVERFSVHLGPSAKAILAEGADHIALRGPKGGALGDALGLRPEGDGALDVFPLRVQSQPAGCLVVEGPGGRALDDDERVQARQLADQAALGVWSVRRLVDLGDLKEGAMTALALAIDASSHWTSGHSRRVTELTVRLAALLGLPEKEISVLHSATMLHDIGKIGVPTAVLDKNGRLTDEEYEIIKTHVTIGEAILKPIAAFEFMLPIVRHHHERFDGRGYPDGLSGKDIPFGARIVAVADTFDALVSDRPYRPGKSVELATRIIEEEAGAQFDPKVVGAFMRMYTADLKEIVQSHRERGALEDALPALPALR
ncbi:MAG: HD domain-containing phosphohydrolase [Gemmatimonadota bacterium]